MMPTKGLPLFCHGSGMKKEEILDHYDGAVAQYDGLYSQSDILAIDRELIALIEAKSKTRRSDFRFGLRDWLLFGPCRMVARVIPGG